MRESYQYRKNPWAEKKHESNFVSLKSNQIIIIFVV